MGNAFSAVSWRAGVSSYQQEQNYRHLRSGASPTNPPHLIAATLASLTSTLTLPIVYSDFSVSIWPLRGSSCTTLSPRVYENYDAKMEPTSGSKLRRASFRIETHSSGLKLDLNVGRVDTFVKDRQGNLVIGFVELVSASGTGECLRIWDSAGRPG